MPMNARYLGPGDLPEVIALPIAAGSARYLEWLSSSLTGQPQKP